MNLCSELRCVWIMVTLIELKIIVTSNTVTSRKGEWNPGGNEMGMNFDLMIEFKAYLWSTHWSLLYATKIKKMLSAWQSSGPISPEIIGPSNPWQVLPQVLTQAWGILLLILIVAAFVCRALHFAWQQLLTIIIENNYWQ